MASAVLEGIGAEGIGVDDPGAGADIGAVHGDDVVGTVDVPVLGALSGPETLRLQQGSHAAVKKSHFSHGA